MSEGREGGEATSSKDSPRPEVAGPGEAGSTPTADGEPNRIGDASRKDRYGQSLIEHLGRRAVHLASSLFLIYFFLPDTLFEVGSFRMSKPLFLILIYVLVPVQIEARRVWKGTRFFLLREYEEGKTAAYLWSVSGAVLLLLLTEFGLPQYIAAPCILVAAIGDPLLGELRPLHRRYTWGITYFVLFCIFYLFLVYQAPSPLKVIFPAALAAVAAIFSESLTVQVIWGIRADSIKDSLSRIRPLKDLDITKRRIFADDNLLIQLGPAIILVTALLLASYYGWGTFPAEDVAMIPEMTKPLFTV